MGYRAFLDEVGTAWEAWDVLPRWSDRRVRQGAFDSPDRRKEDSVEGWARSIGILAEQMYGWLCFQSVEEKRRLSPIPERWEEAPVSDLVAWLKQALPVPKMRGCVE